MKLFIDCDGPVLDVQPAYWEAYSQAVSRIGLPRTDPAGFWRLVRTAGPIGRAIIGAKPRHLRDYETHFAELIESDDIVATCSPQPNVGDALQRIKQKAECALITAARNRAVRQRRLDEERLSAYFFQMRGLAADASRRPDQLRELADGDRYVVVAAATIAVVNAAAAADMLVVGVANGSCTSRRLTQAGVRDTFADLAELADDLHTGAPRLRACGLPTPQ